MGGDHPIPVVLRALYTDDAFYMAAEWPDGTKSAFKKPYIIGYHRCQYIDRFAEPPGVLKQGMIRQDGTAYETLVQHVREANAQALNRFVEEWK